MVVTTMVVFFCLGCKGTVWVVFFFNTCVVVSGFVFGLKDEKSEMDCLSFQGEG